MIHILTIFDFRKEIRSTHGIHFTNELTRILYSIDARPKILGRNKLRNACSRQKNFTRIAKRESAKKGSKRLNAGPRFRWHLLTKRNSKPCASSKHSDRHQTAPTKIVGNSVAVVSVRA